MKASAGYEKNDGLHAANASFEKKTKTAAGDESLNANANASLKSGAFSATGEVSKSVDAGGRKSTLAGKASFSKSATETRGSVGVSQQSEEWGTKRDRSGSLSGGFKDGKLDAALEGVSRTERENESSELSMNASYDGGLKGSVGRKTSQTTSETLVEKELTGSMSKDEKTTSVNVERKRTVTKGENVDSLNSKGEVAWGEGVRAKVGAGFERTRGDVSRHAEGSVSYADKRVEAQANFSSENDKRTLSGNAQVGMGQGGFKADAQGAYGNEKFDATAKAGIGQGRAHLETSYKSNDNDSESAMPEDVSFSVTGEKGSLGAKIAVDAVSVGLKKGPDGAAGHARFEGQDFGGGFELSKNRQGFDIRGIGSLMSSSAIYLAVKAHRQVGAKDLGVTEANPETHRVVVNSKKTFAGAFGLRLKTGLFGGAFKGTAQKVKQQQWITCVPKDDVAACCQAAGKTLSMPTLKDPLSIPVGDALRVETSGSVGMIADIGLGGVSINGEVLVAGDFEVVVERLSEHEVIMTTTPSKVRRLQVEGKILAGVAAFSRNSSEALSQTYCVDLRTSAGLDAYEKGIDGKMPHPENRPKLSEGLELIESLNRELPKGVNIIKLSRATSLEKKKSLAMKTMGFGKGFSSTTKRADKVTYLSETVVEEKGMSHVSSKNKLFKGERV